MLRTFVTLLIALALSGCSAGASQPAAGAPNVASPAPSASATAPSAAASASPVAGHITVYAALTDTNGTALANAFQQANPQSTVDMVTGGTGALITRIESELRSGGIHADVLVLADPTVMGPLRSEGALSAYAPRAAGALQAGLRGDGWTGAFMFNNVILYRDAATAPADWSDLTNASYKDKVELGDPSYSGTTLGMVAFLSSTLGWDFFRQLQQNGAKVVQSTNTVGTDIAQGSVDVGISLDSVGRDLGSKGSPVKIVWPTSGAIPVPAPVAIVKGHESPVSQGFLDWLFTDQGQAQLVKLGYAPIRGTSDAVPPNAKQVDVDWTKIAASRDSTIQQFKSIFP